MSRDFQSSDSSNIINIGDNVEISGSVTGKNNEIDIASARSLQKVFVTINGDNNRIKISSGAILNGLRIEIGSRKYTNRFALCEIGSEFSIASKGRFLLPNIGNILKIGNGCMFSNNIVIRGGEYPHLIFDDITHEYLDQSEGIFIGDHVWVGEGAYINKSVSIPDGCIVGARSVVTKRFENSKCVIAGNPAKIVKHNVNWTQNTSKLLPDSPEKRSFEKVCDTRDKTYGVES